MFAKLQKNPRGWRFFSSFSSTFLSFSFFPTVFIAVAAQLPAECVLSARLAPAEGDLGI